MKKTKVISFVLALFMLISMIPINVFASVENSIHSEIVDFHDKNADPTSGVISFSDTTSPTAIGTTSFIFDASTGTITGYEEGNAPENLVIPAEINGVEVKHIGDNAFKYSSSYGTKISAPLKTLTLPEGLKTTGHMSFQGNELSEVTIPSTIEKLGERTFGLNKKLTTVNFELGSNLKVLGVESLYDCSIENIELPEGLEEIGNRALSGNKLTSIQVPDSVTKIGQSAFQLNLIEEFYVPEGIEILNGETASGGLFFRNFNDTTKEYSNLRFTKVYDTTGKATALNTRGIVNPVSVNVKYINSDTYEEIKPVDNVVGKEYKKIVIKKHPTYGWDVVELGNSDERYIYDYMAPSKETDLYNKYFEEIAGNYFTKNQEVTFAAPEIPGYNAPEGIVKALTENTNEVIFLYEPLGNVNLTLEGEGLASSLTPGEVPIGSTVSLTIDAPVGKKISLFTVNGEDKTADLSTTGVTSGYSFRINCDTIAKVEYIDISYTDELKIESSKTELKLGEKAYIKAFYRDVLVNMPNDDIVWAVDHDDIADIDINTGEVSTLKSGTVVLKAALKSRPEITDTITLEIIPVKVKVRVEADYITLLDPVEVEITNLDLSEYNITSEFDSPKAIHAIVKALDEHKETTGIDPSNKEHFDAGSTGSFISEIGDYGYGDNHLSGWMFYIDNDYVNVGINERNITNGEYINLWRIDTWLENTYVYFENEEYTVEKGKELVLQLVGNGADMESGEPVAPNVEGITILNDTVPLEKEDGSYYTTDVDGKVTVKFDEPGKYHISAMKTNDDGELIISRPYTIVNVIEANLAANTPSEQLEKNLAYLVETVDNPIFGIGGGEWSIISLARAGYTVPDGYYDIYYNNVVSEVQRLMPAAGSKPEGRLDRNKGTEHSRLILGLTAIGKGITDIGGYDISEALADYNYVIRQGINGPIFALIALDSHNYEMPVVEGVTIQTTRQMLIDYILNSEIKKDTENAGGWALSGTNPDPDITSMAIQALTPYYEQENIKAAVDRAIMCLSNIQKDNGGFASWGTVNSESIAQVVVALTGLGIDPHTDTRFVKNGNSVIDALMAFAEHDGGFKHILNGSVNGMATDQGTYALVAYDRFVKCKNSLYNMNDVEIKKPGEISKADLTAYNAALASVKELDYTETSWAIYKTIISENIVTEENTQAEVDAATEAIITAQSLLIKKSAEILELPLPEGDNLPEIIVPNDSNNYKIPITAEDSDKEITITISENKTSKVVIELPSGVELPKIEANKGNISAVITKGTQVISGDASAFELINIKNKDDADLLEKVNNVIANGKKLDEIAQIFSMGRDERIEFSDYVTLTFAGMSGKDVAYIQGDKLTVIQKYSSYAEGQNSGKNEYAYDEGENLIVKTKHFTDFIAYSTKDDSIDPGNGGGGGTTKHYITLSIDKKTIDKGYVLKPTKVEFTPGKSVWDVLKREMDDRNIDYDYTFTPKYNSIYVESIDGDGEFDHGEGSGWMYNVNKWYPNYGASLYELEDNDVVQWRYTTNYGVDLGEDLSQWEESDNKNPTGGTTPETSENPETEEINIEETYSDYKDISSWAIEAIKVATKNGFISGYKGMFSPKSNITRAEFTKLIVNILGLNINVDNSINFKDVNKNDWFYPYINAAYKANIVEGSENKFNPNDNITREQMAVIIVRALGLEETKSNIVIKDLEIVSDWAKSEVETAVALGVVTGYNDNFDPKSNATREMAAVVAMRGYYYKSEHNIE